MNVFKRELKFKFKSTILWIIGVVVVIALSFSKFSMVDESSLGAMNALVNTMPQIMKSFYGMSDIDISSLAGYAGVIVNFALIMISLHGLFLGMSHIGVEKKNKTMDFIFVKPISKKKVLLNKIIAGLFIIIVFNTLISVGTVLSIKTLGSVSNHFIKRMTISFFLTDIFFYALGVFISVMSNKKKFGGVGVAMFFIFYLIAVLSRLSDSTKSLGKFTPLEILSGAKVIKGFDMFMIAIMVSVSMALLFISFRKVDRKEV